MSVSHHGPEQDPELIRRFLDQVERKAKRHYSAGRLAPDDDGDLAYAIAADPKNQRIVIRFGKPVEWIGLAPKDVEALRDKLSEKLLELRGIVAT